MEPPRNILIVEDEVNLCNSLAILFEANGYRIKAVKNGEEALNLLKTQQFDVAIFDVHLSDMLSIDILPIIRKRYPDLVTIVMTGDTNIDIAIAALKCGAYDYLRKPFEFEEILKRVENAFVQKDLQKERDGIYRQLYLSEKKYRYLVENSPDIIYTTNISGNFSFLSESIENVLGYTVNDLVGRHFTTIVCDEDIQKVEDYFSENRSHKRINFELELRLRSMKKKNEKPNSPSYLTVELRSMGIYEDSNQNINRRLVGTHGIMRDISEKQRLEDQLRRAERTGAIGTLASGIAHDFNNLLMGIQGRIALVLMDLNDVHPHFEHLQLADDYIRSASGLTKQLLGLARGGKNEVKPFDINGLIEKTVNMFGRTKKEITIQTQFNQKKITTEIDCNQIEQAFLNLFVNAWQAMPEGGNLFVESKVIELEENICKTYQLHSGLYVQVSITDTGTGMDQETFGRIFDPFFTTKERERGTGLGLASAYGIIKNHGGYIDVESEIGIGTTFDVFLPITDKQLIEESDKEKIVLRGFENILLVDDEEMIIKIGREFLEKLGYQVITAGCGEDAIKIVDQKGKSIDLIILDMIMPGMDGGRTFDRIHKTYPEIPIILASGCAMDDRVHEVMLNGCNGFIQKPYTFSEISQKVRKTLDGSKNASEKISI